MIYLAAPYSHEFDSVKEHRYHCVNRIAAILIAGGEMVFSPISHSHPIAKCGIDGDWDTWSEFDLRMIEICDEMVVLMLDGWRESKGVKAEIERAKYLQMPIKYFDTSFLFSTPQEHAVHAAKAMMEDQPE